MFMIAFPFDGTIPSTAAYKSYPAASTLPRVGMIAFADNFLIKSVSCGMVADNIFEFDFLFLYDFDQIDLNPNICTSSSAKADNQPTIVRIH